MAIYTIVYESKATQLVAETLPSEIEAILTTARRRNPEANIGGALLVTEGRFVQALEGDQRDVQSTFDRISLDPRHQEIEILCAQSASKRRFAEWSMAFVGDTATLRARYAGEPLAALVHRQSGDSLINFMREIAMNDEDE